jgi:hypothetical protein
MCALDQVDYVEASTNSSEALRALNYKVSKERHALGSIIAQGPEL